jgi:hypothetical protein
VSGPSRLGLPTVWPLRTVSMTIGVVMIAG